MDLEKITAKIRPRRGWEAIDLGVNLVQHHASVLYKIWFSITLPLFFVLLVVFYSEPIWAIVAFWWLKPILERPLLHFLSRELFGEGLSAKQCIKAFYTVAKTQWFFSLTTRRLSFTRAFDLPLIQLEGLKGNQRSKRLRVIHSGDSGSAVWLTIIFFLVEIIFYLSMMTLLFLMIPDVYLKEFNLFDWIAGDIDNQLGTYLFLFLAYFSISLVAPFYVACGFSLYINQRTQLEAWDIELAFKRLASRLSSLSSKIKVRLASWFSIGLLIFAVTPFSAPTVYAAETPSEKTKMDTDLSNSPLNDAPANQSPANQSPVNQLPVNIESKKSKDLDEQAEDWEKNLDLDNLSHREAKRIIEEIKESSDFHKMKRVESHQYRPSLDEEDEIEDFKNYSPGWMIFAKIFAVVVEFALWIFIAVLVLFLILKYKHLLVRGSSYQKKIKKRPAKLFGLDLDANSLPDKPWLIAKNLIQDAQYREALSLLYRASLIWYIDNSETVIKEGHTELECLKQISNHVNQTSQQYMSLLTQNWRSLAYAHQLPEVEQLNHLCDHWPAVMVRPDQVDRHSKVTDE